MKWAEGLDKLGLGLYVIICLFAIANIWSVDEGLGEKQATFFVISLVLGFIIFVSRSKLFENLAAVIYIAGVLLLVGLFPFGTEILGQRNWYKFGGFTMQPVEFAKIGTALMLANYVSGQDFNLKNRRHLLTALAIIAIPAVVVLAIPDVGSLLVFLAFVIALYREGFTGWIFILGGVFGGVFFSSLIYGSTEITLFLGVLTAVAGILILQNIRLNIAAIILAILLEAAVLTLYYFSDRGLIGTLYYVCLGLLAMVVVFLIIKKFIEIRRGEGSIQEIIRVLMVAGAAGLLMLVSIFSHDILEKMPKHQKERIAVLYEGEQKYRDTSGYNLLFSKTAIGSGGLTGKGYRQGSVTRGKFVPEQETDYIFCTVGEEWGFLGSSALVLIYCLYIGRIYFLAERQKTIFNRFFGYSFASVLLIHFFINMGMVMGLFPTVGIPLPYFSYGGSSLVAFSIMTFIFFKLNYADRNSLV